MGDLLSFNECYWYIRLNSNYMPINKQEGDKKLRPWIFRYRKTIYLNANEPGLMAGFFFRLP